MSAGLSREEAFDLIKSQLPDAVVYWQPGDVPRISLHGSPVEVCCEVGTFDLWSADGSQLLKADVGLKRAVAALQGVSQ